MKKKSVLQISAMVFKRLFINAAAIVAGLMMSASAQAQWTVANLHPAGATFSQAVAASGSQQVGYAGFEGGTVRAGLWSGTAASWVDLHPAGARESRALAASGLLQAGYASVGGIHHASLWSGTAASWVDLHAFLSAEFSSSDAWGISTDGINIYVSGSGFNTATGREEALLWTQGHRRAVVFRRHPGPAATAQSGLTRRKK